MKKIFKIVVCFFTVSLFIGCGEENRAVYNGDAINVVNFDAAGSVLKLNPSDLETYSTLIKVNVTSLSNVDRTFVVSTSFPSTTLDLSSYFTIDSSTLVIPAGSYEGYIKVTGNYDNIDSDSPKLVRFTLVSIDGAQVSNFRSSFDLAISKI
jgi:hypothetical protein